MNKMSEEEIIQTLENRLKSWNNIKEDCKNSELSNVIDQIEKDNQATQGLLDLYNKQKEETEKLKKPKFIFNAETGVVTKLENDCIGNDKIRNKINELTLKNKIPIKDQFVMYDVIRRNFQIEILEELLNEEGDPDAK